MLEALKRTPRSLLDQGGTDIAAALTYYAIFSLFPALIALVSVLSLVGEGATQPILDSLEKTPTDASDIATSVVTSAAESSGGLLFVIGLATTVWAASGYVGAFGRAANEVHGVEDNRPFWKSKAAQLGLTIGLLATAGSAALAAVLSGPIARQAGDVLGVGDQTVETWNLLKLPALVILAALAIALLLYAAPQVPRRRFGWVLPGAVLALLTLAISSYLLTIYFSNFANYNKTYGALGGVIALLFWLWVSNLMMLAGVVFNYELRKTRGHA
jgi:membrane protein